MTFREKLNLQASVAPRYIRGYIRSLNDYAEYYSPTLEVDSKRAIIWDNITKKEILGECVDMMLPSTEEGFSTEMDNLDMVINIMCVEHAAYELEVQDFLI